MVYKKYLERLPLYFLSMPFIYGMVLPLLFLDLCISIYHSICFRLYNLPLVKRSEYFRFDRHKLSYLTWYQKLHCTYCSYANGLLPYAAAIAADTEKFWCGIMNERRNDDYKEPKYHQEEKFVPYGDEDTFQKEYYSEKK